MPRLRNNGVPAMSSANATVDRIVSLAANSEAEYCG